MIIIAAYLVLAVIVTTLSVSASHYVDLLDKKTSLSGAFIGGALLSAVTSLPELFTSLSSTVFLNTPELCLGNILGSDLFNVAAISVVALIFLKGFRKGAISKNHQLILVLVIACYAALGLSYAGILDFEILTVSVVSLIIFVVYGISMKALSGEEGESDEEDVSPLTLKQVVIRFILVSVGIVVSSILITYATDAIAELLNLGKGLAGALLLGIATSLPELSSTIALFRMGNYDIAVGNIVGSNIFNFCILAIVDIFYVGNGLYVFDDPSTIALMGFGAVTMISMLIMLWKKNRITTVVCPVISVLSYIGFLMMG